MPGLSLRDPPSVRRSVCARPRNRFKREGMWYLHRDGVPRRIEPPQEGEERDGGRGEGQGWKACRGPPLAPLQERPGNNATTLWAMWPTHTA